MRFFRIFLLTFIVCTCAVFYSCEDCDMDCGCGCKDCPACHDNCCTDCRREPITASFAKDSLEVYIGETKTQTVTTNCPDAEIVYISSNPSVASVDPTNGTVTGLTKGQATITATVKAPQTNKKFEGACAVSYQVDVDYRSVGALAIGFGISINPDLLELVTPIVTYKDGNGVQHEEYVNAENCTLHKEDVPLSNGEMYHYEMYHWSPNLKYKVYENSDLDETISVKYVSNNVLIDPEREYELYVNAGIGSVTGAISYNNNMYIISKTYLNLNININIGDGLSHIDGIYTGQSVQMFIDELVKTKQDFRVEASKDGKVKVNGE